MDANTPYLLISYIANQFQRGNVSPARYQLIINQAQTSFLNYLLGQLQQYQYGSPASRVQFGVNETARQRLTPLIDSATTLTLDSTSFTPYPPAFEQVDAMYDINLNRIRFVPQHKLPAYLDDPIDPVATNPIYILESGGFRFYGLTPGTQVKLSFVHTPPAIVWNSAPDGQGRPQYTAAGSTPPVWYDVDMLEVISRALKMVGVNLQAAQIGQYAEMIIDKGQ